MADTQTRNSIFNYCYITQSVCNNEILASDLILAQFWCQNFCVPTFRTLPVPLCCLLKASSPSASDRLCKERGGVSEHYGTLKKNSKRAGEQNISIGKQFGFPINNLVLGGPYLDFSNKIDVGLVFLYCNRDFI